MYHRENKVFTADRGIQPYSQLFFLLHHNRNMYGTATQQANVQNDEDACPFLCEIACICCINEEKLKAFRVIKIVSSESAEHRLKAKCVLNMVKLATAPASRQCSMSSVPVRSREPMPSQSINSTSVSFPSLEFNPEMCLADSHTPSVHLPPAPHNLLVLNELENFCVCCPWIFARLVVTIGPNNA